MYNIIFIVKYTMKMVVLILGLTSSTNDFSPIYIYPGTFRVSVVYWILFVIGHKSVDFLAFFTRPCPSTCILPSGFVGVLVRFNFRKICRFDEIYWTAPSLQCFCWLSNCSTFVIGGIQPDFDFILFSGKICGNAIVAIYLFQMKSKHCI